MVCISVVLGVVSQLSKLWQNDSGSTGKRLRFLGLFLYTQKCDQCNLEADVMLCVTGVPGIEFFV